MKTRPLLSKVFFAKSLTIGLLLSTGAVFNSGVVQAETIQIPIGQQGQNKTVQRPRTGQSQESVRTQFGNPIDWTHPVGDPPITKWTYGEFMVYFEYDHVIHSVLKHTPQPDAQVSSGTVMESESTTTAGSSATDILRGSE